jgi:protein TonB
VIGATRSPDRIAATAVVVGAHVLVVAGLLHLPGIRERPATAVIFARVLPEEVAPRKPPPPLQFVLAMTAPRRVDLPLPDIVLAEPARTAPAAAAELAPSPTASTGVTEKQAPAATFRPSPPEIQSVRYARPIALAYPPASRRMNETGVVVVRVLIDADGTPIDVWVQKSSGHVRLDEAALAAVRKALFVPYRENGVARVAQALVPIRFELR